MSDPLGTAIAAFDGALAAFQLQLDERNPSTLDVLPDQHEWMELLRYKLAPRFTGGSCLIAAVCGGTNTGKSTIFNLLLGGDISPVRPTAAATCRPVIAVPPAHYADCLDGRLIPEFEAAPLDAPEAALDTAQPATRLFAARADSLPGHIALMDTPDVDSIDKQNWSVANYLRAAGDVVLAVLTGEKYKDQRVVEFFRAARAAGRIVIPLMNKANPEKNFEIARAQLRDFLNDTGLPQSTPCFVAPLLGPAAGFGAQRDQILNIENGATLLAHLQSLDAAAIKKQVYRESILRFAQGAREYLDNLDKTRADLQQVAGEFEHRARQYAERYDPAPGAAVGGLFHEFVQSKRGAVGRTIGTASQQTTRAISAVGHTVSRAIFPARAARRGLGHNEEAVNTAHREMILRIANELAASYVESARNLPAPVGALILPAFGQMDLDAAADAVIRATLKHDNVSEAFRAHAFQQMEDWWENHKVRRNALVSLDYLLMISPAAIAGIMSLQTAGAGVYETMIVAGPLMEQFAARVLEYQFGDALFGLLKPWREEQRQVLHLALLGGLAGPALKDLHAMIAALESNAINEMKRQHQACLQAL